ncbi:hypothetical protein [Alloactinosynnema sp. L-07]|uniref:hypothetical protein n=1 Tax=Alloactinosynnema sp. L-07 TaxID=1653480 RepID=UPI00065EFABE|nr:hypothetical protein [Alloactinosynnema sp. L-07]CRK54980.1 hypothetical protein [Alloactinosynnema sp. L-07]
MLNLRRGALTWVPRGLVLFALAGCSAFCSDTAISVVPPNVGSGPVTFEAKLTSGGDPVAGARLDFYILAKGANGEEGHLAGQGTTGGDGVARVVVDRSSLDRPGATLSAVEVTFDSLAEINGEHFCESKARVSLP